MKKEKICSKCSKKLPATFEFFYRRKDSKDGLRAECKECKNKVNNNYKLNHTEEIKEMKHKWYEENKEMTLKLSSNRYYNNREVILKQIAEYQKTEKGREVKKKAYKKHLQTEKGKITHRKAVRKNRSKRKRNMGFIELIDNPFPKEIEVDYHHINNLLVIPIPRRLHQINNGSNVNDHRKRCNKIIKELYDIDINYIMEE